MIAKGQNLTAICLFLLSPSMALAGQIAPSFDCSRAQAPDEQQICKDGRLAELDQAITLAFKEALEAGPKKFPAILTNEIQKGVRDATRDRLDDRHACGASPICILDVQVSTMLYLEYVGANVPIPPGVSEYRLKYQNNIQI
jgi:uncharacterized protein